MTATRVSLDELNAMCADDFITVLSGIYEHSPWVAAAVAGKRPFVSLVALDAAMAAAVIELGAGHSEDSRLSSSRVTGKNPPGGQHHARTLGQRDHPDVHPRSTRHRRQWPAARRGQRSRLRFVTPETAAPDSRYC